MAIKIETQYAGSARVLINGELIGLVEREGKAWIGYNRKGVAVTGRWHSRAWAASVLAGLADRS